VVADPYASLAEPSTTGLTNYGAVNVSGNSSRTLSPGIYTQITVSGNATVTLEAGVYIIEGGGFTVSGNATVKGSGVTIFNAGSNYSNMGGSYGSINVSGNASVALTAPSTGTYTGIVFFQSRDDTQTLSISGNAFVASPGTVYLPDAQANLSGNAMLDATLVVNELSLSGNSDPSSIPFAALSFGSIDVSGSAGVALTAPSTVNSDPGSILHAALLAEVAGRKTAAAAEPSAVQALLEALNTALLPTFRAGSTTAGFGGVGPAFGSLFDQPPQAQETSAGNSAWELQAQAIAEWSAKAGPLAGFELEEAFGGATDAAGSGDGRDAFGQKDARTAGDEGGL
jgi:hypothetical protein